MLWSWIAVVVYDIAGFFFALFPQGQVHCPAVGTYGVCVNTTSVASDLAGFMGPMSYVFPVSLLMTLLTVTIDVVFPAVILYEVVQFIYREVPNIFGSGGSA